MRNAYLHEHHPTTLYLNTPHHTTHTMKHLRPKGSKESKPIYPSPQTDIDMITDPQGCVKSKSYTKPKVNASRSPPSSVLYNTPNSQLLFWDAANTPLLWDFNKPAWPPDCDKKSCV